MTKATHNVNPLEKFERFFEGVMEGAVGRIFRSPIQPTEIGRRLERAMEGHHVVSVDGVIVPNDYTVSMHPADMVMFADFVPALCEQMEQWLIDLATGRDYRFMSDVRVQIVGDDTLPRRAINVESGVRQFTDHELEIQAEVQRTEVYRVVQSTGNVEPKLLHFLNGRNAGESVLLRGQVIQVGRALDNDIIIEEAEVSRHHARIEASGASFVVVDQQSTNGTRVNGQPITRADLHVGDVIEFGTIRAEFLPYEGSTPHGGRF